MHLLVWNIFFLVVDMLVLFSFLVVDMFVLFSFLLQIAPTIWPYERKERNEDAFFGVDIQSICETFRGFLNELLRSEIYIIE